MELSQRHHRAHTKNRFFFSTKSNLIKLLYAADKYYRKEELMVW